MSKKQKDKGIGGLVLFLGWLVFILLILIFYFYFSETFLDIFKKKENTANTNSISKKEIQYEINKYPEINSLMKKYLDAQVGCDKKTLMSLVTNKNEFEDMTSLEKKATVIIGYEDIICYTVPGYFDGDFIVYVVSNISFAESTEITSKPLNINYYYVKKHKGKYLIDNKISDDSITEYINNVTSDESIQKLYKEVKTDIDTCVNEDEKFAEFYNKLYEQ